jgi:predicted DsbA family dithiol-disulfide isomerase
MSPLTRRKNELFMEAVVQILEADVLMPVMHIPAEMRNSRIEVTLRPVEKASSEEKQNKSVNTEIMQKFMKAAESGEAKEHLKRKLAEGTKFPFDAEKLISGTMTESDWQNLYTIQKQAWPDAAAEKNVN